MFTFPLAAQIDTAKVEKAARDAVNLMDRNLPDKAIEHWDVAIGLRPDFVPYRYERAICHVMAERYDVAIQQLLPIYREPDLFDRGYQLLGNCFDIKGDSSKSLPLYREGLKAFPNSGRLHYELGASAYLNLEIDRALAFWVRGTKVEPGFATNYYWIAKAMGPTDDRIWSVLYGELFLNLEPGTARTKEISEQLYRVWNAAMELGHENDPINFCSDKLLEAPGPSGPTSMNFATAFEFTVATSSQGYIPEEGVLDHLSIEELVDTRYRFFKGWQSAGYLETYPNDLFDWHAEIDKAGYLREYFWWTLAYGDPKAMQQHYDGNTTNFDNFMAWIGTSKELPFDSPLCVTLGCSED